MEERQEHITEEPEMKSNVPAVIEESEQVTPQSQRKVLGGLRTMLDAIRKMVGSEQITPQQARDFRLQLGVSQAYFTRRQPDKAKRRARNKIAKSSRRVNHLRGHKGQTNRGGQRYSK